MRVWFCTYHYYEALIQPSVDSLKADARQMDAEKAAKLEVRRNEVARSAGIPYTPRIYTTHELNKEANRVRSRDLLIARKETARIWKEHQLAQTDEYKHVVAECAALNGEDSDEAQRTVASK